MPSKIKIATILHLLLIAQPLHAAITLDGTLGRSGAITGPSYAITSDLGKQSGTNLFHSFSTFNLVKGDIATFSGPTNVSNIISRVTGGSASSIDGTLKSTISGANMYFLNPAGVMFGPNASIDISGSFHVSTANYLKFPDGNYYADTTKASTFSSAPPEAFGFLGTTRAAITIKDGATLAMKQSQSISIVGGDIEINKGTVSTLNGGEIRVVALGQKTQEIGFTGTMPTTDGNLSILNGGSIYSSTLSATDAGSVKISAGKIVISGKYTGRYYEPNVTGIYSDTLSGTGNAGNVEVLATGDISIANFGKISSNTSSKGNAGSIEISTSGNLYIGTGSQVFSRTLSYGDVGSVKVSAANISIDGRYDNRTSVWYTDIYNDGRFDNGTSAWFTGIDASSFGLGKAGNIDVSTSGKLLIASGGTIVSSTFFSADAGYVKVRADSITIDGRGESHYTGIYSEASPPSGTTDNGISTGNACSVDVSATGDISLFKGGSISSSTLARGNAGSVNVSAKRIIIDDQAWGAVLYKTGIFSQTRYYANNNINTGDAGNVDVFATEDISIFNGGQISSSTNSSGNAGSVKVNAGSIIVDNNGYSKSKTGIFSQTDLQTGKAGSVEVLATGKLSILKGGAISSSTLSPGDAGSVKVGAGILLVDGTSSSINAAASTGSSGQTGSVSVAAAESITLSNGGTLSIQNEATVDKPDILTPTLLSVSAPVIAIKDAKITAATTGNVAAGNIMVNTGSIAVANKGSVTSDTSGPGKAGNVDVSSSRDISLEDAGQISSSTSGPGIAGTVKVNSGTLLVNGTSSSISAKAAEGSSGQTGSVSVTGNDITLSNGGQISISNEATVPHPELLTPTLLTVTTPSLNVNGGTITAETRGNVAAGNVEVTVSGGANILSGGSITSETFASGTAGSITVTTGSLAISGGTISTNSQTDSSGNAGNVTIDSGALTLSNDALISSESLGSGKAGNLDIKAVDSFKLIDSSITTATVNAGGGSITIDPVLVHLKNSSITTSVKGGTGNGGNIELTTKQLVVDNSRIVAQADAGNGGNINLNADVIIQSPTGSLISASSNLGVQGSVVLSSPVLDVNAALVEMPSSLRDIASLSPRRCITTGDEISSFVVYACGTPQRQPDAAIIGK